MGALYGHTVVSELPLARLREGNGPRGTIAVRRVSRAALAAGADGEVLIARDGFTVRRDGATLAMRCAGTGTWAIDVADGRIDVAPAAVSDEALEHRLACVAVPLLLAARGDLALHAAAVAAGDGAVAFAGPSGRGKSTLAWALGGAGFDVLAEDGCVVTGAQPLLWPGLAGVRLLDGPARKRALEAGARGGPEPRPLRAVVLLGARGGDAVSLERVDPADALVELMPNTIHAQGASQAAAFRAAAAIARAVPVYRGSVPDDLPRATEHAVELLRRAAG